MNIEMTVKVTPILKNITCYFEGDVTRQVDQNDVDILNKIIRECQLPFQFKLCQYYGKRSVLTIDQNGQQYGYSDGDCNSLQELFDHINEGIDYYYP